ncbi:hypothetical protein [Pseudomonas sp. 39167]|uniref:hypothetical protein n=1 Tax=Pseudomonas sp. 39167 TaxID=2967215 RepID=UPI0023632A7F|nr:hypothetical protein [Pseudomonas sp. 39167]MDD2032739.1 hypothetical protein [Pseudomonas sp. 39167]
MSKLKDDKVAVAPVVFPPKRAEGVLSVSMSFESFLVESHKKNDAYLENWFDSEIKKSSNYFKKEIYSEE